MLELAAEAARTHAFDETSLSLTLRSCPNNGSHLNHPVRKPEASLLGDFDMAAMIVPYVDVFATENYLAELLRTTGIARDYGCNIYTMKQKEQFLEFLS